MESEKMKKEEEICLNSLLQNDKKEIEKDWKYFEDQFVKSSPVYSSWMTHPYAISTIASVSIALIFYALYNQQPTDSNIFLGVVVALAAYLLLCSFQLRDSLLVRPHPVFWRLVKGLVFAYFLVLIWLIFQDVNNVRQWLKFLSPELGVELPEKDYGASCAIYTPGHPSGSNFFHVKEALFDAFLISHLLGWFCKTLLMRDWRLVFFCSLVFELYEITFKHLLPNFNECWWDTLILDIGICNTAGIIGGYYFLKYFQCKQYNFVGMVMGRDGKKRWKPLERFRYLAGVIVVLIMIATIELNAFFLKFVMWIRASHWTNLLRVIFWWLHGCAATRELYFWMQNPGAPIGIFLWLLGINAALESLISFKFGKGMFPESMPPLYFWSWVVFLSAFIVFVCIYYPLKNKKAIGKYVSGYKEKKEKAEGAAKKEL